MNPEPTLGTSVMEQEYRLDLKVFFFLFIFVSSADHLFVTWGHAYIFLYVTHNRYGSVEL